MSKIKKALRAVGAKVKKSTHSTDPMADASAAARMSMYVNAQVVAATEKGLQMGLGIDAAESLRLLAVENGKLRELLSDCRMTTGDDGGLVEYAPIAEIEAFLKANPPQKFVLKAVASAPPESTDSSPAVEPPTLAEASLVQGLPVEPQAGEAQVVQSPS